MTSLMSAGGAATHVAEGPGVPAAAALQVYRTMVLARILDDRCWVLCRQGQAAFAITGQGHEAVAAVAAALRPGHDYFLPYYRDTALVLALGMSAFEVRLGLFARAADPCSGGRQMPSHWSYPRLKILTQPSPVGTQVVQAAGVALAARLRGEDSVTYVSFGDGSTSEGDFHEGLNFAAIHRLPVVFYCENNGYAISVPAARQSPVATVAERAAAYGIPGVHIAGHEPDAVYAAVREAATRARAGLGPTLIDARVARLMPHSTSDDDTSYRSPQERESEKRLDPLPAMRQALLERGILTESAAVAIDAAVLAAVNDATDRALASPEARPEDALLHVYAP